ncbi:TetR/AcrR family transcriptional regulator [Nocardia sp. 2]|uniref:TetR/AcrR family transcriptional regulator n=1 Tax=Nocardia acididurans TaxID=2802282 RepID=A0ABS1M810_9NOCA|nr:TetR family transcriptional regulator [Nocardia acididurans]MBL1076782.1 TetR/AcrR family transcriptional regulator [Nocardia acididurans]
MAKTKTWGGRSAEQRRGERRERLLDSALALWREGGWTAVTIRAVCARTSLNDRYFYEAFTDRDELLVAAWESVRDDMLAALTRAFEHNLDRPLREIVRLAATVVVDRIAADPAYGRILLLHNAGSPALEECRARALRLTVDLVVAAAQQFADPAENPTDLHMNAIIGVGGFVELITAWQSGVLVCDSEQIVDHVADLVATFGTRYRHGHELT